MSTKDWREGGTSWNIHRLTNGRWTAELDVAPDPARVTVTGPKGVTATGVLGDWNADWREWRTDWTNVEAIPRYVYDETVKFLARSYHGRPGWKKVSPR